jgi:hypothetical protein
MNTPLLKAVLLASIAMTMPLAANAAQTSDLNAPVYINGVQVAPLVGGDGNLLSGTVSVSFTNLAPQPANEVVFSVRNDNGRVIDSFDDYGTFSQGVAIHHNFTTPEASGTPKIDIEKVTFADGSEWMSGRPSPLSRRQSAQLDTAPR